METPSVYVPMDRRQTLARGTSLPERSHGAALFADISGFTPLTEALVRALGPRRGAEELTRQLNGVYDTLIAEVDRFGGSVIGFAGDAVTCWFDGDGGPRATACGLAMQDAIRAFKAVSIPSGDTVSLAAKVAIAAGPARRFAVGDPEIQCVDVVAGATLERMAAAEHLAEKGDVVVDEVTATTMGTNARVAAWRIEEETGRRFALVRGLTRPVADNPWPPLAPDALPDDVTRTWLLPPIHERLSAGQGEFLAELRPAVALFLRFGSIDYDADEDAGARLDTYIRRVQRILARYGGYLLQVTIGDKGSYLYAAFGAPISYDDDAERAVAAALELCPPHGAAGPERELGIGAVGVGIRRGRMRVGSYGGMTRRTYGVLGDEVNMAARLMGKAAAGEILLGERVADAVARRFDVELVGQVTVKGKAEPLVAWRVLGRRLPSSQRPATLFPHALVGREEELARMAAVVETALAGQGQILRLQGAAGVGKSHLVAELVERALRWDLRVVVGACQSTTQETAYAPWRQVFRALLGLADAVDGEPDAPATRQIALVEATAARMSSDWLLRLPLLGDLLGLPIPDNATTAAFEPRLRRNALCDLAVDVLQHRAREQPLLLMIDDVHWMDEASQGLTLVLSRVIGRAPLVLVLVHRPPLPGTTILPALDELAAHHRLDLDDLTTQGVAALVADRLSGEPTALALSLIHAQTQGNPFFVEEMVDTLRESGRLVAREDGRWDLSQVTFAALRQAGCLARPRGEWILAPSASLAAVDLGLPDSIEGLVLSRIDRLPEADKLTLRMASVIGRTFALDVLAQAHPLHPGAEALAAQLDTLQARDFARVEEPDPHRRYMFKHNVTHGVAYDTLLFSQRRQLHQAVGEALERVAPDAVAELAHHAYMGEDWRRALHYEALAGRQAQRLFATHEGIEHFKKALHSAEHLPSTDSSTQCREIHAALGELLTSASQYDAAGDHLEHAFALALTLSDRDGQADACRCFARLYELRGDYAGALDWITQSLEALGGEETPAAAQTLITAGLIRTRQGDYAGALAHGQQSLSMAERIGDARAMARAQNLLGVITLERGNTTAAIPYFEQALDLYTQAENIHGQGLVHNGLANAYFSLGRWTDAGEHYRRAREIFSQIGDIYWEAAANNNLGSIARDQGRLDDAVACYQDALRSLEQIGGSPHFMAAFSMNLGNALIRRGDVEDARRYLRISQEHIAKAQSREYLPELYRLVAEAALRAGDLDEAGTEARQALDMARELAMRGDEGISLRVLGEVASARDDLEQAARLLVESLSMLREVGDEYQEGRSHLALATAYLRQGKAVQARTALDRCMPIFRRLDAFMDLSAAAALHAEAAPVP